jgi:hypothetical protein
MPLLRNVTLGFCLLAFAGLCEAAQDVGRVVALRGKATIERGGASLDAGVNAAILESDVIRTASNCRVKMRFVDDTVLTLGENSRLAVKEFIYSKGTRGKSIFNLIDGKLHSVVGHTKFEVQTPTAVAAARGTVIYFEVGNADELEPSAGGH